MYVITYTLTQLEWLGNKGWLVVLAFRGGSISKMFSFYIRVFYVMCKELSGELSCMRIGLVV